MFAQNYLTKTIVFVASVKYKSFAKLMVEKQAATIHVSIWHQ